MTEQSKAHQARGYGLIALLVLLLGILAWQTNFYRGVVAWLGEWQFGHIDIYYPILTSFLIALLAALPAMLVIYVLRRRKRKDSPEAIAPPPATLAERSMTWTGNVVRGMLMLAVVAAIGMVLALVALSRQPEATGAPVDVNVATTTDPAEGSARLIGQVDMRRVAVLRRMAILVRRDLYLAPVTSSADPDAPIRYFIEIDPRENVSPDAPRTMTGILKRAAFPGELAALYRLEGRAIDRRPYVLFASEGSLRWPNYASALQLLVLALGALLFAGLFRWRHQRMATRFTPQMGRVAETTPA